MVTVRQLLELMHEDDWICLCNDDEDDPYDEFDGSAKQCLEWIPNTILNSAVAHIYSGSHALYIYREVRK